MKRVTLGFSILVLSALFIIACKKPTENVVPEPDTEVQTAIDASWATFVISDIETMCCFMGENTLLSHFYTPIPGVPGGTMTALRDTAAKFLVMSFSNTACMDGRTRDGSVLMQYGNFSSGEITSFIPRNQKDSQYSRSYGFGGFITLSEYKVDGWKINTDGVSKALFVNEVQAPDYDPKVTPLTWSLKGRFIFTHPTDSTKNMVWEGSIFKTCINSNLDSVFKATKNHKTDLAVDWRKAIITYSGTITGTTSKTSTYTMTVGSDNPIRRDFKCYAYKVGGVVLTPTAGVVNVRNQEFHPFISGIASFTTTNADGSKVLYPRQIYYGNEGKSVPGFDGTQCDNVGEVYIKGIYYKIDFRQ